MNTWRQLLLLIALVLGVPASGPALELTEGIPLHGFLDARGGIRTGNDPGQRDTSLLETRLQLALEHYAERSILQLRGDFLYDNVAEKRTPDLEEGSGAFDLREANLTFSPIDIVDVKLGRQILTWGTGDLLFINDLFPKDWQAFFTGRDEEYLKAPSDALLVSLFPGVANVDLVYTPRFDSDRFLTGERLSFSGSGSEPIDFDKPDDWFDDHEITLRVSRNLRGYELAAYAYRGYWKRPQGFDPASGNYIFPRLNVFGASLRGGFKGGIVNLETGYYDSRDDSDGDDPWAPNSEIRLLVGYERELLQELTGSLQFYLEELQDYSAYRQSLAAGQPIRDEQRQVWTLRLTKQLLSQTLTLSLFSYWSPTDEDYYLRPQLRYKLSDAWLLTCGGNLFGGETSETFFGQLEDNSNIYAGVRYSF
ncbi:MAG: hypothetical protein RQ754_06930 [Desulfuromonadales bacterium]|nr:hypothetical protein [Desulfuromonadales bacterium]